jgi:hypothetical protein
MKYQDAMEVIRHDYPGIKGQARRVVREILPCSFHNLANVGATHHPIFDVSEHALPIPGTDGHKVRGILGVVIAPQADGVAIW